MGMAFDGLSSGLDTTAIIESTLAIQRKPAAAIEKRIKNNGALETVFKDLRLNVNSLKTAATDLRAIGGSFMPVSATSSSEKVKASASTSAMAGEISFHVDQAASKHVTLSKGSFDRETKLNTTDTALTFKVDGKDKSVSIKAGSTLEEVTSAINKADIGVKASMINTGNGFKLQLSSKESGASSDFEANLNGLDNMKDVSGRLESDMNVLSQGADAKVTIGKGTEAEFTATSKTNTFSNVLKGVSFTISKGAIGEDVTITADADHDKLAAKVDKLVGTVNTILGTIDSKSKGVNTYDDKGNAKDVAGPLKGNATTRDMRNKLVNTFMNSLDKDGNQVSMMEFGIEIKKDGTFTFDKAKFIEAAKADPERVEAIFNGDGSSNDKTSVTARMRTFADEQTDTTKGTISKTLEGITNQNKAFKDQVEAIDDRIEMRRQALVKQYAGFEGKLGELKRQQSWLMSQLAGLPR